MVKGFKKGGKFRPTGLQGTSTLLKNIGRGGKVPTKDLFVLKRPNKSDVFFETLKDAKISKKALTETARTPEEKQFARALRINTIAMVKKLR